VSGSCRGTAPNRCELTQRHGNGSGRSATLPAGVLVEVVVTSRDVIHAFWIPRLAGKIDAVPGHANLLRIQADVPGRYQGLCNEFCGTGHSGMRFDVIVHPAAEFSTAIAKPDATGKVAQ